MNGSRAQGQPAVRALVRAADVQRFGLLSAAAVVARYAEVVDRTISGDDAHQGGDPETLGDTATRLTQAGLRLLDAGASLVERLERTQRSADPVASERLEPPATAAGGWTEAAVWAHNPTSTTAEVAFHATSLVTVTGAVLAAHAVECHPADPVRVPPLGSCAVRLRVTVPDGQPPGRYHGLVVGSTAPAPMPLIVVVTTAFGEVAR